MLKYEEDHSRSAVEELKKQLEKKGQWQAITDVKGELDKINFEGLYNKQVCYNDNLKMYLPMMKTPNKNWSVLEPMDNVDGNNEVAKLYNSISKPSNEYPHIHLGTVSNGVHATELIERYFTPTMVQNIDYWNTKKVMVVYEAPANNLDCSHALMNKCDNVEKNEKEKDEFLKIVNSYIKEKKGKHPISLTDNLTSRWWRLDEPLLRQKSEKEVSCEKDQSRSCHECFKCFSNKSYTGFLLALISHFGLANMYTTNYCRIELFEEKENKKNKEGFVSWDKTLNDCKGVFIAEEKLFLEEYKHFEPDIVLATSNPYYRLLYLDGKGKKIKPDDEDSYKIMQEIKKDRKEKEEPHIIKIPHPASRYPYDFRLCYNMCMITRELEKIKAITKERADEIFNHFREMNITDYATNNGENNNENDME